MIKANIKDIAEKNGISTAYQLQKKLNIQPSLAAKWYRNDLRMIGFDSLNSLCKAFNCLPSDILVYVADDGVTAPQMPVAVSESVKTHSAPVSNAKDALRQLREATESSVKASSGRLVVSDNIASDNEKLLSTAECAERLNGVSERTVSDYYVGKSGGVKLVSVKVGTKRFVRESDLNDFIARRGEK